MDTLYAVFEKLLTIGTVSIDDLPELLNQTIEKSPEYLYEEIIPSIQAVIDVDQRELVARYLGASNSDIMSAAKLSKRLEANFVAAQYMKIWSGEGKRVMMISDLPKKVLDWPMLESQVQKMSVKSMYWGGIVNYCGEVYFSYDGMFQILCMCVRNKVITARERVDMMDKERGEGQYAF